MRKIRQPRAAAINRCAFALCGLSLATLAQAPAPADKSPDNKKTVEVNTRHQTQAAEDAYLAGARLLDRNDIAGAEIQFDKAVKLNPSNSDYAMAYSITHQRHVTELVKESGKARLLGQNEKAETLLAEARLLDPQNNIATQGVDPGALPKLFHSKIEPRPQELSPPRR
jgi:tetratricopeptide (TPR) repeat protein